MTQADDIFISSFKTWLAQLNPPSVSTVLYAPVPHNDWTPATQTTIYGKSYWTESPETSHSLQLSTNTNNPIVRCETRDGELWTGALGGNDSERCELDSINRYPKGSDLWFASSIKVEEGLPQLSNAPGFPPGPLAWCALMQIHSDGTESAVPWQLSFVGDTLSIKTQRVPNQTETVHWTMPVANFVHGHVYDIVARIKITGTNSSSMTAWVDGIQVCNVTNLAIGGPDANNYVKCGIYRGWENQGYPPLVVYHANIQHGTTSLLSRVNNPPSWPVVNS